MMRATRYFSGVHDSIVVHAPVYVCVYIYLSLLCVSIYILNGRLETRNRLQWKAQVDTNRGNKLL